MDEMTLDEVKARLREAVINMLAERHPVERAQAFTLIFMDEMKKLLLEGEHATTVLNVMLMQLIQTCNRHPEWMRAVCEDQKWITEEHDGATFFEAACLDMISWYPLSPKYTEVSHGS